MEHYVNIMLDKGFKTVFGNKQVAIDFFDLSRLAKYAGVCGGRGGREREN